MKTPKVWLACFAGVLAGVGTMSAPVSASVDNPVDAGDVAIVDANNRSRTVSSGDSNTIFSVRLPSDATCPGDSANDDWRVQSFIVPADMDPGALEYGALRPVGDNLHALYGTDTRPYVQAFLAQNSAAGQPAQILDPPPLSFAVFPAGTLPDGEYRIGVACTYFRDTAKFWDTTIVLTTDAEVQPGQFRWELSPDAVRVTEEIDESGAQAGIWLALGLAGVVVATVVVIRSRRHSTPAVKETA